LLGREKPTLDHAPDGTGAHAKLPGSLLHREELRLLMLDEHRNLVRATKSTHSSFRPCVAGTGDIAKTIEDSCGLGVLAHLREIADQVDNFAVRATTMVSGPILRDSEFGVYPSGPVKQQVDLGWLVMHIDDDLFQNRSQDSLFQGHRSPFMLPREAYIPTQLLKPVELCG